MGAVTILFFLLATGAAAAEPQALVVRVERSLPEGLQQQALSFESERVTLARNSNFLCPATAEVRLGTFVAKKGARLEASRALLEQIDLRVRKRPPGAPGEPAGGAHGARVYLGETELTGDPAYEATVTGVVEDECALEGPEWEARDAIAVSRRAGPDGKDSFRVTRLDGSSRGKSRDARPGEVTCERAGKRLLCRVADWGFVAFRAD
jgi:hypothetical protein